MGLVCELERRYSILLAKKEWGGGRRTVQGVAIGTFAATTSMNPNHDRHRFRECLFPERIQGYVYVQVQTVEFVMVQSKLVFAVVADLALLLRYYDIERVL